MKAARAFSAAPGLALALALALVPASAAASTPIDPLRADRDVSALRDEGRYGFCEPSKQTLGKDALEFCSVAREVKGCEALVERCKPKSFEPPKLDGKWMKILGPLAEIVLWVIVAALLVALAFPVFRAVQRWLRDRELADAPESKRAPEVKRAPELEVADTDEAEVLLKRAEDVMGKGDHGRALYLYLHASLRALDRRGAIRVQRDRTNGEYVRSCKEQGARTPLREIVRAVDGVQFGGEQPSRETAMRISARAVALVRAAPLTMLAIALFSCLFAAGCGGAARMLRGTDPAGDDVLQDLLERQGLTLSKERGALASLPMPQPDEVPPAILIDVQRVPLDEETTEHLLRWVEAGGKLALFGRPEVWPKSLEAKATLSTTNDLVISYSPPVPPEDEWLDPEPPLELKGRVVHAEGLEWPRSQTFGKLGTETYAAQKRLGKGLLIAIGNDDLLTNIVLSREGNAAALMGIVARLDVVELRIARPEDGTSPPTNPLTSLVRAGLGLGLVHALVAVGLLFLAVGVRLTQATPTPPPRRRAFAEHVTATGLFYARAKAASHALAVFARWVDERVRASAPRGTADPAAWIAARTKREPDEVAKVWKRAMSATSDDAPVGDELATIRQLGILQSGAIERAGVGAAAGKPAQEQGPQSRRHR